jgi:hypothetical protein
MTIIARLAPFVGCAAFAVAVVRAWRRAGDTAGQKDAALSEVNR